MGYNTEMDGCGRFMKYSLFLTNFIIFVSLVFVGLVDADTMRLARRTELLRKVQDRRLSGLICLLDWRDRRDGPGRVGFNRQSAMDRRARGKRSADRCGLRAAGRRNRRGAYRLLRMYRRVAGSQMHAPDGKCRLSVWNETKKLERLTFAISISRLIAQLSRRVEFPLFGRAIFGFSNPKITCVSL